tara:strand:- start:6487 stop:6687 length:201 start_codon:yes stop_codon:yes gene_type:complete
MRGRGRGRGTECDGDGLAGPVERDAEGALDGGVVEVAGGVFWREGLWGGGGGDVVFVALGRISMLL